jgi:hypothetical protein
MEPSGNWEQWEHSKSFRVAADLMSHADPMAAGVHRILNINASEVFKLQCYACQQTIEIPTAGVKNRVGKYPACGAWLLIDWYEHAKVASERLAAKQENAA